MRVGGLSFDMPAAISLANPVSPAPPVIIQEQASDAPMFRAALMKYSAGQRLAGPYSAPGFRPSIGVPSEIWCFARKIWISSEDTAMRGGRGDALAPSALVRCR